MKKLFFMFLMVFTVLTITACNGQTTTLAPTTEAPTTVAPTTVEPTTAAPTTVDLDPVFVGVEDRSVLKGTANFNYLEGITITDDFDSDLLSEVVVTGEVDVTIAGDYEITLTVTDNGGNEVSVSYTVTVFLSEAETKALADIDVS